MRPPIPQHPVQQAKQLNNHRAGTPIAVAKRLTIARRIAAMPAVVAALLAAGCTHTPTNTDVSPTTPASSAVKPTSGDGTPSWNVQDSYAACAKAASAKAKPRARNLPPSTGDDVQCLVDPLVPYTLDGTMPILHQVLEPTSASEALSSAVLKPFQDSLLTFAQAAYARPWAEQPDLLVAIATPKPDQQHTDFVQGILASFGVTDIGTPVQPAKDPWSIPAGISCGHKLTQNSTVCAWVGMSPTRTSSAPVPFVGVLMFNSTVPTNLAERSASAIFAAITAPGV
jgi:hypothetical protein